MNNQTYLDGIEVVALMNNSIRAKTFCFGPKLDAEGKISREQHDTGTVVMSIQGFLSAYKAFGQLFNELVDKGVLQKAEQTNGELGDQDGVPKLNKSNGKPHKQSGLQKLGKTDGRSVIKLK